MNTDLWGFARVAAAVPHVHLADCAANEKEIAHLYLQAEAAHAQIVCFPELSVTGYTCADLFLNQQLIAASYKAIEDLVTLTHGRAAILV
ncbi:MAG: NAD(+) synthase, partial [Paludibacteraceae bacterium]|nr:NAD(+) synthase [Paludibacteraceae bacterium]